MLMLTVWIFTVTLLMPTAAKCNIEFDKTEAEVGEIVRATVKVNNIKNFAGYQVI